MGKVKRIVSTGFWEDKKVIDDFSVEDRYFMLYLLTNPHTTQLGIYELPISTISNETGYNRDVVRVLIDRFMNKYDIIQYSYETGEVAIKNYLNHSIVKGGKPVFDCLIKEEKLVSDKSLLVYIYNSLSDKKIDNITVIDFLNYIKNEYENEIDNDNDNDNERIVPRIVTKGKKQIRNIIPPTIEMVMDYCLERNNSINPEAFMSFYDSNGWMVGKNKMKDWQAAVRTWELNNKKKVEDAYEGWLNA